MTSEQNYSLCYSIGINRICYITIENIHTSPVHRIYLPRLIICQMTEEVLIHLKRLKLLKACLVTTFDNIDIKNGKISDKFLNIFKLNSIL